MKKFLIFVLNTNYFHKNDVLNWVLNMFLLAKLLLKNRAKLFFKKAQNKTVL